MCIWVRSLYPAVQYDRVLKWSLFYLLIYFTFSRKYSLNSFANWKSFDLIGKGFSPFDSPGNPFNETCIFDESLFQFSNFKPIISTFTCCNQVIFCLFSYPKFGFIIVVTILIIIFSAFLITFFSSHLSLLYQCQPASLTVVRLLIIAPFWLL